MVKQYEEGRKQKAEWHKQQKDTQPFYVWEIVSGEHTGSYIVGRLSQHWADFDKPSVPEQADLDEYNKVIGASVQSLSPNTMSSCRRSAARATPSLPTSFREIIVYHVRPGKDSGLQQRCRHAPTKPSRKQSGPRLLLAHAG